MRISSIIKKSYDAYIYIHCEVSGIAFIILYLAYFFIFSNMPLYLEISVSLLLMYVLVNYWNIC